MRPNIMNGGLKRGDSGFQLKYVTLKFYVRFYCWIKLLLGILHISTWHKMLSHKILVTTQLILFPVLVNKLEIEFQKKSAMNYFDEM